MQRRVDGSSANVDVVFFGIKSILFPSTTVALVWVFGYTTLCSDIGYDNDVDEGVEAI